MLPVENFKFLKHKFSALAFFLILSIFFHIMVLSKLLIPIEVLDNQNAKPLDVQLQQSQVSSEARTQIQSTPETLTKPLASNVLKSRRLSNQQIKNSNQTANVASQSTDKTKKTNESLEIKPTSDAPEAKSTMTPREVYLEFNIVTNDGMMLGLAQQHFILDSTGNYQVTTGNKFTGIGEKEDWQVATTGKLYGNRLSPSTFHMNGKLAERLILLSRESKNGEKITKIVRDGRMPDGILDLHSLMYHFMFSPPNHSDSELILSDGAKISTYAVTIVDVEFLNSTTFGKIETVHILLSNIDNNESIALWLAPVYDYLPLMLIHSNNAGISTDLIISTLTIK